MAAYLKVVSPSLGITVASRPTGTECVQVFDRFPGLLVPYSSGIVVNLTTACAAYRPRPLEECQLYVQSLVSPGVCAFLYAILMSGAPSLGFIYSELKDLFMKKNLAAFMKTAKATLGWGFAITTMNAQGTFDLLGQQSVGVVLAYARSAMRGLQATGSEITTAVALTRLPTSAQPPTRAPAVSVSVPAVPAAASAFTSARSSSSASVSPTPAASGVAGARLPADTAVSFAPRSLSTGAGSFSSSATASASTSSHSGFEHSVSYTQDFEDDFSSEGEFEEFEEPEESEDAEEVEEVPLSFSRAPAAVSAAVPAAVTSPAAASVPIVVVQSPVLSQSERDLAAARADGRRIFEAHNHGACHAATSTGRRCTRRCAETRYFCTQHVFY